MPPFERWFCLDCDHSWEVAGDGAPDTCEHCGSADIELDDPDGDADLFADADQAEPDEDAEQAERDRAGGG